MSNEEQQLEMGECMLKWANQETREHLLSNKGNEWKSGYLTERSRKFVEQVTGKTVRTSVESGEYFYRVE